MLGAFFGPKNMSENNCATCEGMDCDHCRDYSHWEPIQYPVTAHAPERDPHGKAAHESGSKLDADKNRLGLVLGDFARALKVVGDVGTYGAKKYTEHGWVSVPNGAERYTDAMLRHYLLESVGESADKDTGILHAGHLAWNALARLDLMIRAAEQGNS